MYNTDFLPQLEKSRRRLFGSRDPRELPYRFPGHYSVPPGVEIVECIEDTNGEWVPRSARPSKESPLKKVLEEANN